MNKFDLILLSVKNIFRRKTRTILTVSGVVIGTAAIVIMMSIGFALDVNFKNQAKQWGNLTTITVMRSYGGNWGGKVAVSTRDGIGGDSSQNKLDDALIETIEKLPNVMAAMPIRNEGAKLVSGRYVANVNITGLDAAKMKYFDFNIEQGRILEDTDNASIVVGAEIPYQFYDPKKGMGNMFYREMGGDKERPEPLVDLMVDPVKLTFDYSYGEKIIVSDDQPTPKKPKLYKLSVVGSLKNSGEYDYSVYMDINYLTKIRKEYDRQNSQHNPSSSQQGYNEIRVKVDEIDNVLTVQQLIKDMGYEVYSLMDFVKNMQEQTKVIRIILGGIGAVSLLVAALGITNTMIMSIYERTKEIGIMKVIGCRVSNIRNMFLLEAGAIGFSGGALGVLLSLLASVGLNFASSGGFGGMFGMYPNGATKTYLSVVPLWLCFASIGFATVIGIISGFYPAWRATRLSALEAIRND